MNTYFCPRCGKGLESSECAGPPRRLRLDRLRCPQCAFPVELSGAAFLTAGGLACVFAGLLFHSDFGLIALSVCGCLGGVRLFRQRRAWRKMTKASPEPG